MADRETTSTLVQLSEQLSAIRDQAEWGTQDEEFWGDTLDGAEGMVSDKLISCAFALQSMERRATEMKALADAYKARIKAAEATSEWMRRYILAGLKTLTDKRLDAPEVLLSVRRGAEKLVLEEGVEFSAGYMFQPPTPEAIPDKAVIKSVLQSGTKLEGASLTRGESLNITWRIAKHKE